MKRLGIIFFLLAFTLAPYAQQKKTAKKPAAKKTATTSKKSGKSSKSRKSTKTAQPTVKSLQNERQQIQQEIKKQESRLRDNEKDVKRRLQNLMVLNNEIEGKRRTIDTIRKDISHMDVEIEMLMTQLEELQDWLQETPNRL
jgi:predicted  nucleic acid-binding Zn-ribbon protein